jgi:hypothetical protein
LEVAIFISQQLPFVRAFGDELNAAIQEHNPAAAGLTATQRGWLSFCLRVTDSIGWARFERAGLGRYSQGSLSWVFRHAKLPWERLFHMYRGF